MEGERKGEGMWRPVGKGDSDVKLKLESPLDGVAPIMGRSAKEGPGGGRGRWA